jgi:hypothetical protein
MPMTAEPDPPYGSSRQVMPSLERRTVSTPLTSSRPRTRTWTPGYVVCASMSLMRTVPEGRWMSASLPPTMRKGVTPSLAVTLSREGSALPGLSWTLLNGSATERST